MRKIVVLFSAALVAAVLAGPALAASPADTGQSNRVQVTVTVVSHGSAAPPEVPKDAVIVHQDGKVRRVLEWVPAKGSHAGLDLAIVIDNAVEPQVSLQFPTIEQFIRGLPATARVAVIYVSNGTPRFEQNFTTDHELAAKAFHIPSGPPDVSGIYQSLHELLKRWPSDNNRRAVLLISDGIDTYRGIPESAPGLNEDLQAAIDASLRAGVNVYTLFASGAARLAHNFYLVSNGQGCLARLAAETGGESYFLGSETPVTFKPYLEDLERVLGRQYVLAFEAELGTKPGFARLQVSAEQPGVELIAPDRVYLPAASK